MKSIVPHLVPIDDLVVIVGKNYKRTDVIFYARFKLFCHLSFISSPNKVVSSSCFLSRFGLRYVEARWRRVVVWPGNSYHSTNGSDSQALYVSITNNTMISFLCQKKTKKANFTNGSDARKWYQRGSNRLDCGALYVSITSVSDRLGQ